MYALLNAERLFYAHFSAVPQYQVNIIESLHKYLQVRNYDR